MNGVSVDSIEKQINERIGGNWNAKFRLSLKQLSPQDVLKSLVTADIEDCVSGQRFELDQFGSGFQRSLIFELINAKVRFSGHRPKNTEQIRLLIFEEPEAFLHIDQQDELARNLRKISNCGTQIICTSHAQAFVSREMVDVTGIVRLDKGASGTTAYQMTEQGYKELIHQEPPYPDYLKSFIKRCILDLDLYRYACWFDGHRSKVFFSSQVLLVEGATEMALISRLLDEGRLSLPKGTVVVDCLGKYNYYRFIRIMNAYGIKLGIVIDSDSNKEGNNLIEQKAWNRFVEEEANKCQKVTRLWKIEGDLESFLGIRPVAKKDNDLKPYNLLKEYDAGRYNKHKMKIFCKEIAKLLGE